MPAAVSGMKECSKCGETKDVSEYYNIKSSKDGLASWCKSCQASRHARWHKDNKEANLEYARQYYADNREKILPRYREYSKQHYVTNREDILTLQAQAYQEQPAAVYEIENKATGKTYIGQSRSWRNRWNLHKSRLSRGIHGNPSLQADYNEHGLDAFEHRVVQEYPCDTSSDALFEHEQRVIDEYISEGKEVYNMNRHC